MICIVLADRPHGSCKPGFETWSQDGKIWKRRPCVLVWTANLPSPLPSTSSLRPLTPRRLITATTTTTTMVDHMLVLVLQKIFSLSELLEQNILLLCHYAEQKRIMDNPLAIFVCFFLCSVSSSTVCLYTSFMRMLRLSFSIFGEFQVPPIWDMNYSVLSRLQWIHSDANILETMPKKTGEQFG